MDNKEKPKTVREDVKCIDCKYYEGENWKPWWSIRYCHHPKIFRTGLINTTFGCEGWEKNMKEKEKDFITYFKECIDKGYLVMEKRITLQYMEEAIKAYETSQSDLYAANQIVADQIDTIKDLEKKLETKSKRVKLLIENSKIISKDYDDLEKEKEALELENNQLKDFQAKYLGLCK